MTEHRFSDTAAFAGLTITDAGNAHAEVWCARTGCQDYLRSELGFTGDGMISVYRPEGAVFDRDSLATYAGKPVTMGHPQEMVTADNWKQHAVGAVGDEIARDGDFVKVPFRLLDTSAILEVKAGTREISMGYTTPIKLEDGVAPDGTPYQAIQTGPIKINHMAIVPKARGGEELRIGDGAANWGATPRQIHADMKGSQMADNLQTVVLGDQAAQVAAADAPKVEAFKAATAKAMTDAAEKHAKEIAKKDEEIGTLKADKKALEDAAMTPEKISQLVADRVALESVAKSIFSDAKTDGVSDADLRKSVVAHKLGDAMVADASDAEIAGMFKAIAKDVKSADPFADAKKKAEVTELTDRYAKRDERLSNAYKKEA